jgi:hypothetical protein
MADTPEDTIRAAAEAYIRGDEDGLYRQLDDAVRMLGSEQRDNWGGRDRSLRRLKPELERRRALAGGVSGELIDSISGSLIDCVNAPESVEQTLDLAWWSATGDLNVDGAYHRETSWTVVLRRDESGGGDWKIVHSHFSIHR